MSKKFLTDDELEQLLMESGDEDENIDNDSNYSSDSSEAEDSDENILDDLEENSNYAETDNDAGTIANILILKKVIMFLY